MKQPNSKLHDDLVYEVSHGTAPECIRLLCRGIADRIEQADGNPVRLSDLKTVLREDTSKLSDAILRTRPLLR